MLETVLMVAEFACVATAAVIPALPGISKWWMFAPLAIYGTIYVRRGIQKHRIDEQRIEAVLKLLIRLLPEAGERQIRCTYHAVTPFRHRLRQAFDYVPFGGGHGRTFPQTKGIIGRAAHVKATCVENFIDDVEYRNQMVNKYNYTIAEVGERNADRRSYFCRPILSEDHEVRGVLYADSSHFGTFEDPPNAITRMVLTAAEAIQDTVL